MVIRHYLAAEKEDSSPAISNKTEASDSPAAAAQPPAATTAPNQSEPATAKSSTADSSQTPPSQTSDTAVSKEPTPTSEATSTANSQPTTSPSPLDSTTTPPPPSSTSSQTEPSPSLPQTSSSSKDETSTSPQSNSSDASKQQQTVTPVSKESTPPKQQTPPPHAPASSPGPQPTIQPVKSLTSVPLQSSPSAAKTSSSSETKILGFESSFLMHVGIALLVIAIIVIIIVILYRRYRTRVDYNQSPQNFAHKPELGFNEEYYLNHNKVEKCLTPEKIVIEEQNLLSGKIYQVEFKGTEKSAVYFHRRQVTTAYFEIEVLQANGSVQIGFLPCTSFIKLKNGQENIGNAGVGITNTGFVQSEGENVYNYSWSLAFGDVFGIGITKENSKFSERRAWISKNGVLLNFPPNDEMDKWLATIEISAEEKAQYNIGVEKKEGEEEEEEEDQQKVKEKAQRQKIEVLLRKQRISLKTFNKFDYYPVIFCHGNKDEGKSTVISINVGGQIFRMYDTQFRSGLLKDKALFGDD